MNLKGDKVFCHNCNKWIDLYTDTLLLDDRDIVCDICYPEQYICLGYIWDVPQWRTNELGD